LKWAGADAGGSGSRDELALDDIVITAHQEEVKVIISEVADHSISDQEYVEIYNGGSLPIDIEGWKLVERYNPNNIDEREITFNPVNQKNSGGEDYFKLNNGEYAVVVRVDAAALKSNYLIGDDIPVFENFWPPAMTGDERYLLVNAFGDVIDKFGEWEYTDESTFRLTANSCYERINEESSNGEAADNWSVSSNTVYNFTPGSVNNTPLPVEMVFFNAKIKADCVLLCWQTASEINNYGFDIERSQMIVRAQSPEINYGWKIVGFVQGYANSYSTKNYSFTDSPDQPGRYFYRLKQIDIDGRIDYSDYIAVNFSEKKPRIKLFQNYPNPFNPVTTIEYFIPSKSKLYETPRIQYPASSVQHQVSVSLKVYDILGREVAALVNERKFPGKYKVAFEASNLPSGIYFYTIKTPEASISKKMIIMK
jgi:hypothetical protein